VVKRQITPSKFQQLNQAVEQPQPLGAFPNRVLVAAAVADPYGIERRRKVRVTIAVDTLDRLLMARRIGPGEHAAGRTYQRLLEISLGGSSLEGGGVRTAQADDIIAKAIERAGRVHVQLSSIRRRIGWRSERLLRQVLVELNPNTGHSWTLAELAELDGGSGKQRAFAVAQRLVETLEDLAAHWRGVRLD
jgi:hypothetical protein